MKFSATIFGAVLLLAGGLVHLVQPLNETINGLFGGKPLFQMVLGFISLIVGIVLLFKKRETA